MGEPCVHATRDGAVAWLRLNRPAARNALDAATVEELDIHLTHCQANPEVRVVVLTGTGPAFCAGADLKGISGPDGSLEPEAVLAFVGRAAAVIERVAALHKPVIAAINGLALAGGLELVMACDLAVAADTARLGDAHANFGLLPGAGGAARLPRLVGPRLAKRLLFTGANLPAADFLGTGLIDEVVPAAELAQRVAELAATIAARSPAGLAHMKRLVDEGLDQPLATALRLEQEALAVHVHSADLREGLAAFREKRVPQYPNHGAA